VEILCLEESMSDEVDREESERREREREIKSVERKK